MNYIYKNWGTKARPTLFLAAKEKFFVYLFELLRCINLNSFTSAQISRTRVRCSQLSLTLYIFRKAGVSKGRSFLNLEKLSGDIPLFDTLAKHDVTNFSITSNDSPDYKKTYYVMI